MLIKRLMNPSISIFKGVMFHKLFEHSNNIQLIMDANLQEVLALNERAREYLGLNLEELNTQNLQEIIKDLEKSFALVHHAFPYEDQKIFQLIFSPKKDELNEMHLVYKSLHDLKQPISIIGSFSQLLERKLKVENKMDDGEKKFIDYINQGVVRINNLMKNLAEYAKVQTVFPPHAYAVSEIINWLILKNEKVFREQEVSFSHSSEIENIICDKEQLSTMLQKLVENSIRFKSTERPLELNINFQKAKNGQALISVQDNGIGIGKEHLNEIFDLYTKFYESEEQKSSGLGLAVVKQIVNNHNGEIWVNTEVNEGTTMFVQL